MSNGRQTTGFRARRGLKPGARAKYGAKALGAVLPEVTRPVFERFGPQRAALMADWATIIGDPLCHFTAPEQIRWQAAKSEVDQLESGTSQPATLIIRVEGPAALEVQHRSRQILERINSYFGCRFIGDIRLLQAPLEQKKQPPAVKRFDLDRPRDDEPNLGFDDERLRTAFQRLWRGIKARNQNQ